ncbi:MAG: hypothetical protein OCU22_10150 [Canidatus Methanoxibalbensis ujae]|nr:hypothetical protein [Candidatus Methanoxibalbensis ujae]
MWWLELMHQLDESEQEILIRISKVYGISIERILLDYIRAMVESHRPFFLKESLSGPDRDEEEI